MRGAIKVLYVYVINLGNVRSLSEPLPTTLAVFRADAPEEFVDTDDVVAALEHIRDSSQASVLLCCPGLEHSAKALGYDVRAWTDDARAECAALALLLSAGMPFLELGDRASLVSLISAAARLATVPKDRDRLWRIDATLRGTTSAGRLSRDVAVIASTSPDPKKVNVTLFASRSEADAYWRSVSTPPGIPAPIGYATLDLVAAYTDALRTALERFSGQTWAPAVAVSDGAADGNIGDLEAMMLAAVTFAVADLAENPEQCECVTTFAERDVTLHVTTTAQSVFPSVSRYRGAQGWWT